MAVLAGADPAGAAASAAEAAAEAEADAVSAVLEEVPEAALAAALAGEVPAAAEPDESSDSGFGRLKSFFLDGKKLFSSGRINSRDRYVY